METEPEDRSAEARKRRRLRIAQDVLECPSAPLMEDAVVAYVRRFAETRRGLRLTSDAVGNLLLWANGPSPRKAGAWVLVAHMDHPGFRVVRLTGKTARLRFLGHVRVEHVRLGTTVRFFARGEMQSAGRGRLRKVGTGGRFLDGAEAEILEGQAHVGDLALWDFPAFRRHNGLIHSRGCDDLLGCATALCVLDEVARLGPLRRGFGVLLTRAEECGFYGALAAARAGTLPSHAAIVSLECSRALPWTPQGGGPVIRVGDRASIFDPGVSEALSRAAAALAQEGEPFHSQRALMDGGTCEATAFGHVGYRAGGLALPLGNYHNQGGQDRGRKRIAAENVAERDFFYCVRLLVHLVTKGPSPGSATVGIGPRLSRLSRLAAKAFRRHPLLAPKPESD